MISLKSFGNAFYSLRKAKGYVTGIVLTLGITFGSLVAMFALNYQLLAASLPYPNADRMVVFKSQQFDKGQEAVGRHAPFPALVEAYKKPDENLVHKALVSYTDSIERRMPNSPVLNTISSTPEYLEMLEAPMVLGRRFNSSEGLDAHTPVAVISYRTWEKLFHKDPQILHKTLNIMEIEFNIIGVTAENFSEPAFFHTGWQADVWLPFDYDDMPVQLRNNWQTSMGPYYIVGLLKPGAKRLAVEVQESSYIDARFKQEVSRVSGFTNNSLSFALLSMIEIVLGDAARRSLLMLAGALGLLAIACTNIVNLIMARTAKNQRTMAIQITLGAQQKHIFIAVLAEIVWLILGASALAIVVAVAAIALLKAVAYEQLPRINELHINVQTFLFVIVMAVALAFLFAIFVSRQINPRTLSALLQGSGKGVALQISARVRHLLILSQIAMAGVLLAISAQILSQSWQELTQLPGFHIKDQYQISLSNATLWKNTTQAERRAYLDRVMDELRQHPKIEEVGSTSQELISRYPPSYRFLQSGLNSGFRVIAIQTLSDANFLRIAEIPLVEGRYYTDEDAREEANVMVVNEALARQLDPKGQVVGKYFYRQGETDAVQVIGVIKDIHLTGNVDEPRFFRSAKAEWADIFIRVKAGQELAPRDINAMAAKVHPQIKVFFMQTTEQALNVLSAPQRVAAGFAGALMLLTVLLAAIGVYGILSYSVQLRRFELGVRMAIGARPGSVFMQVLKDNLTSVGIGLLFALFALVGIWWWVQQTHFQLRTNVWSWLMPIFLISLLTAATSLLSVWKIIRKPAAFALRGS